MFKNVTYDTCQVLGSNTTMKMNHPRYLAASIVLDNGTMWVTGGSTYDSASKTEFVEVGKPGIVRESLPNPMTDHCMVKINESAIILIGGINSSTVYFYTPIPGSFYNLWSQGPSLPRPRNGMACGLVKNLVIITGGISGQDFLKSTLILDLNRVGQGWIPGPDIPGHPLYRPSLVSTGKTVILFGGIIPFAASYSSSLLELQCQSVTQCQWRLMKQKLHQGRYSTVGMLLPSQMTQCNNSSADNP